MLYWNCKVLLHMKHVVVNCQRIGKLLRNEDESVILSYLTPQQGAKKNRTVTALGGTNY